MISHLWGFPRCNELSELLSVEIRLTGEAAAQQCAFLPEGSSPAEATQAAGAAGRGGGRGGPAVEKESRDTFLQPHQGRLSILNEQERRRTRDGSFFLLSTPFTCTRWRRQVYMPSAQERLFSKF